jgi:ankyrin repeat protein
MSHSLSISPLPPSEAATPAGACLNGDTEVVRALLDEDPARAAAPTGPMNYDPLVYVCFSTAMEDAARRPAFLATAALLLDRGADPNSYYLDGDSRETCLYGATGVHDFPALAELLLKAGADPNDGESLYHSTELAKPTCLKLLLDYRMPLNAHNALARLLDREEPEWVRLFLSYAKSPEEIPAVFGHALRRGRATETFAALIDSIMDMNARDATGLTPFQAATRLGRTDVTALLAAAGADTTLTPADRVVGRLARGETVAAAEITPKIVAALDAETPTPALVVLAERGNCSALKCLLSAGANPDVVDSNGWTALHVAALDGRAEAVKILLRFGADTSVIERAHRGTPLGFACYGSENIRKAEPAAYVDITAALLDAGAALPEKASGSPEVQALLVERGAAKA